MKIKVAWIGKTKEPAIEALTNEYLKRISRYADIAGLALKDEAAILSLAGGKQRHKLVLLDSRGKQFSSEELAEFLERERLNAIPCCSRLVAATASAKKRAATPVLCCPWER